MPDAVSDACSDESGSQNGPDEEQDRDDGPEEETPDSSPLVKTAVGALRAMLGAEADDVPRTD